MPVVPVTSLKQFNEIIASDKPVVFDFWATWCGPCRMISPIFERLASSDQFKDHISFYKVDVDEQPDIAQEVGIRAMPTFVLFRNGAKLEDFAGANPSQLELLLTKAKAA